MIEHDKIYEAEITLGVKTDTEDTEGEIIEEKEVDIENLSEEKVRDVLQTFIGKQKQTPPMYSAIKVKRKKII